MRRKKVQKAIFLAAVYVALLVPAAIFATQGATLSRAYFGDFKINTHTIWTPDGYTFDFLTVLHENYSACTNHSMPVVVSCHGLANSKEESIHDTIHFALHGYVLVIPDLRGHASHSGAIRLDKEHEDISQCIDFVQDNPLLYPMANASNVGMWGHSNGAFESVMTAIFDPRVKACIASSGAYNTTELMCSKDSRLFIVGFPWGLNDRDEIHKRSPIELATPTNPENLLLYHGTADTNVPFIHSEQFNRTVNPHGNRTDYEFHVIPGAGHSLVSNERMQNDTAWFDKHLKAKITDPATVTLFQGPFPFGEAVDKIKTATYLFLAGFLPLVFLLEEMICAIRNKARARRDAATSSKAIDCNYFDEIRGAYLEPPALAAKAIPAKNRAITMATLVGTWLVTCFISGLFMMGSNLSRILTFFGIPTAITLVAAILLDIRARKRGSQLPRIFVGMCNATLMPPGDFIKDFVLAAATIIPAWLIQVLACNAFSAGSLVSEKIINLFLRVYPWNPISPGIFAMLGLFLVTAFILSTVFRGSFTMLSQDKFDNTAYSMKYKPTQARELRRFLRWFYMMILYALFVGGVAAGGAALYLQFMPNALVTEVDFDAGFNEILALAAGLVAVVVLLAQQILEKAFRSFNKSVFMTALILLSFFITIAPRPI